MSQNLITYKDFESIIDRMEYDEFEGFILKLISAYKDFKSIESNVIVDGRQFDIVAVENNSIEKSKFKKYIFEIKKHKTLIRRGLIVQFYFKIINAWKNDQNLKPIFISAGGLSNNTYFEAHQYNIEIWRKKELFEKFHSEINEILIDKKEELNLKLQKSDIKCKEDSFIETLKNISPGRKDWAKYQQFVYDILEYLFCPPLESPLYEAADKDRRNRRDIIFENYASNQFWKQIREIYSGFYIVVDAKNHKNFISKRPVIDIAHYLKPYGCGLFGIIISRNGLDNAGEHAIKEQWIENHKLIIVISDKDLIEMLKIKKEGGEPSDILREKISEFRIKL